LRALVRAVGHINLLWVILGTFSLLALVVIAVGLLNFFVRILRDW
jgi:hypothetical protein